MVETNVSPNLSLQGWDVGKWLKGNKEMVKIVLGTVATVGLLYPQYAPYFVAGGVGAIVIKAILDIVDFYASEVKL